MIIPEYFGFKTRWVKYGVKLCASAYISDPMTHYEAMKYEIPNHYMIKECNVKFKTYKTYKCNVKFNFYHRDHQWHWLKRYILVWREIVTFIRFPMSHNVLANNRIPKYIRYTRINMYFGFVFRSKYVLNSRWHCMVVYVYGCIFLIQCCCNSGGIYFIIIVLALCSQCSYVFSYSNGS